MYDYNPYMNNYNSLANMGIWGIIALVIAIVGGIALYFTFLRNSNRGKFTGFLGWMYEFLHFRKITIEAILKITYLILAIFITLASFGLIGTNFLLFLLVLILGNVILRISYELSMIMIGIWRNTTDISRKMSGQTKPAQKTDIPAPSAPTPNTKTCAKCGYVAHAEEKFCRKCGAPLD